MIAVVVGLLVADVVHVVESQAVVVETALGVDEHVLCEVALHSMDGPINTEYLTYVRRDDDTTNSP